MAYLLLRGARQLLTLRGPRGARRGAALRELSIIVDGSVLIRDGRIVEIGSTRRIENLKEARTAIEIDADGRIVVPGFVDASLSLKVETHDSHSDKSFHKRKSMENFHNGSLGLLRSCLQHGTLTAEVKASGGEAHRSLDLPVLRKLAEIGTNPISTVRTWHVGHAPDLHTDEALLSIFATLDRRRLIHFVEFSAESGRPIDTQFLARLVDSNIGVKLAWRGGLDTELLHCLHQFRPAAVYCSAPIFLTAEETTVLSASSAIAVLGAGKEVFEGPISSIGRDLVDAGAAIALSSGYDSASAASYSMQMSIALAVVRLGLTTEEAFSAATINAAYSAGCGDRIGSIEVGKQADLLLLNASDYRDVPNQFGVNHVDMVVREGNVVLNRTRWKAMTN